MARTAIATSIKSKLNGAAHAASDAVNKADDAVQAKLKAARKQVNELRAERDAEHARASAAIEELNARKAEQPSAREELHDRMASALGDILGELEAPSWKRVCVGIFLGIALAAGTGWVIGYVATFAMALAITYTGSMLLATLIYLIGLCISLVSGAVLGSKGFSYIVDKTIDAHAASIGTRVRGWFKRSDIVEFTGAHSV